jgi:hypothetical protein
MNTDDTLARSSAPDQSQCRFGLHLRHRILSASICVPLSCPRRGAGQGGLVRSRIIGSALVETIKSAGGSSDAHRNIVALEQRTHRSQCSLCIANLANHRSPRLFSDALLVTRCSAEPFPARVMARGGTASKQGEGTANNANNANAGCSDIASSLAPWPCTRMICVFCVVCGSPYCWLIQSETDAQRHQRDPCSGLAAADRLR